MSEKQTFSQKDIEQAFNSGREIGVSKEKGIMWDFKHKDFEEYLDYRNSQN